MPNLKLFTGPIFADVADLLDIANPGPVFTGEDNLRVETWANAAALTLTIEGAFLNISGELTTIQRDFVLTGNRVLQTFDVDLGEGWLIQLQARLSAGTAVLGGCYVRLSAIRGFTGATIRRGLIASGFVNSQQFIGYPGATLLSMLDGAGQLRSITGATPAAGAEISETVPTGARWELLTFFYRLVTAVAAANRTPNLLLDDGANTVFQIASNAAQTASLTEQYSYFQGVNRAGLDVSSTVQLPIPTGNRLGAGFRIRTLTPALQAADQFSIVQYLVREWPELL